MTKSARTWTTLLGSAWLAGSAVAQPPAGPCGPPPGVAPGTVVPGMTAPGQLPGALPTQPGGSPAPAAPAAQPGAPGMDAMPAMSGGAAASDSGGLGGSESSGSLSLVNAPTAGTGATAAANAAVAANPVVVANSLILPGLFTAATVQSARPLDRVFAGYSYYDSFKVVQDNFLDATAQTGFVSTRSSGFNLHRYEAGFEKTFLGGRASFELRVPVLDATENTSSQAIDGFGDVTAGVKYMLLYNCQTGSAASAGVTVSAPTARDAIFVTSKTALLGVAPARGTPIATTTVTVNPTFIQPWVGGTLVRDRLIVNEFFGVLVPTDDSVATYINNDLTVGYRVYQACCGSRISSLTPTVGVQAFLPTRDTDLATFSDQVFTTGALQVGLGDRASLTAGVVTPVAGPKAFTVGYTIGFNYLF